ncbi:MAG: hypothetical protein ABIL09_03785 [Gemmatimonadota bacterium]
MTDAPLVVPLAFHCPDPDPSQIVCLTQGVPFADGALAAGTPVRLVDGGGRAYATQAAPLATWAADGQWVRWLLVDARVPAAARDLRLECGPEAVPPPPDPAVAVSEGGGHLVFDSGRLRLVLRRGSPDFLAALEVRSDEGWRDLLRERAFLYMADGSQQVYDSWSAAPPPAIEVEDRGPVRASVCIRGYVAGDDGRRFCPYVLRLHLYAGSSRLRLFHTFVFDQDPDRVQVTALGLCLPLKLGDGLEVAYGGERRPHWARTWEQAHLLQASDRDYRISLDGQTFGRGARSPGWVSLNGPRASAGAVLRDIWQEYPKGIAADQRGTLDLQLWPDECGEPLGLDTPWKEPPLRAKYAAELLEKLRQNPTAGVNFKGFLGSADVPPDSAEGNQQSLDEARAFAEEHLQGRHVTWGDTSTGRPVGLAKTHELWLDLRAAPLSPEDMDGWAAVVQQPPLAPPDPAYTCGTGVLRLCHPRDVERFPEIEAGLEAMFDALLDGPVEECRLYGALDYGDLVNGHGRRHGNVYLMFRDQPGFKATDLVGWMNNESNDEGENVWLAYLRNGQRQYWRLAEAYAEHLEDVDTVHAHPTDPGWVGLTRYHSMIHWGGGPSPSHTAIHGWLLHYFLTGNRRALDVCRQACDNFVRHQEPAGHVRNRHGTLRREFSGPVAGLWALYGVTWEEKYGGCARRSLAYFLRAQAEDGSFPRDVFTAGPRGDALRTDVPGSVPPGGCEHYSVYEACRLTGDPELRAAVLRYVDWILEWYRQSPACGATWDRQTEEASTPLMSQAILSFWLALGYQWTGDGRYLEPIRDLLRNFPALAAEWAAMTGRTCFQQAGYAWQVMAPALRAVAAAGG